MAWTDCSGRRAVNRVSTWKDLDDVAFPTKKDDFCLFWDGYGVLPGGGTGRTEELQGAVPTAVRADFQRERKDD